MFKYIKYKEVDTEFTVLTFRGSTEEVKVNNFDVSVVSLEGAEEDIDALVANQSEEINCVEITKEEFRELVKDSAQLNRIRDVVKARIAERYDVADEVAMSKKAVDDVKRVAYEGYVAEAIELGTELKNGIGY